MVEATQCNHKVTMDRLKATTWSLLVTSVQPMYANKASWVVVVEATQSDHKVTLGRYEATYSNHEVTLGRLSATCVEQKVASDHWVVVVKHYMI